MKASPAFPDRSVCMIGMGYVGLTLAVALAEVGFRLHGVEVNPDTVRRIRSGRAPFREAGLDPKLSVHTTSNTLTVSEDWPAPGVCNVYIVTVGTPLAEGEKVANLDSIRAVTRRLAQNLRPGNMVILRSTVRVGISRQIVKAMLDETGIPYDLAFCPERTLEGRALEELRTLPQIVGGVNHASSMRAAQLFNYLTPTTIRVSDLETAEIIKLINNTHRDLIFAFANEVADICDAIGVSAPEVIDAGNMGYPRGGIPLPGPVGGPCLEKDPYILAEGVPGFDSNMRLSMLGRQVNEALPGRVVTTLAEQMSDRIPYDQVRKGAIMGVAFKGRPETSDLRGTLAIPLIAELKKIYPDVELVAFDPAVTDDDIRKLGVTPVGTADEAFRDAAFVVYQNNNAKFAQLDIAALSQLMQGNGVVYDMWNQYLDSRLQLRPDLAYLGLGTRVFAKPRLPEPRIVANNT